MTKRWKQLKNKEEKPMKKMFFVDKVSQWTKSEVYNSKGSYKGEEDKRLKVCPNCGAVWEKVYTGSEFYVYLYSLPTIGKDRVKCPVCKGEDLKVVNYSGKKI